MSIGTVDTIIHPKYWQRTGYKVAVSVE